MPKNSYSGIWPFLEIHTLNFSVALLDYLPVVRLKFDVEGGKVDHLSLGGVVALIKLSQMMQLS